MGISAFDVVQANAFIGMGKPYTRVFYVAPHSGSNSFTGRSPERPLQTLQEALDRCSANHGHCVKVLSESNTAADTTSYLTETLDWNKDGVDLFGVCAGGPYNKRARIAWATAAASATDIPLFKLSANNCHVGGFSVAIGHADANLSFGMEVTGDNNRVEEIDVPFPTNAANDVAGAYALKINGCDQTLFKGLRLGSFTIDLGSAANQLILVDGGCSMVQFEDCDCISRLESTTNSPQVRFADALAVGFGCLWFKRCNFITTSVNGGFTQAGAFKTVAAQTDGRVVLTDCHTNAAKWDVDDANMILNGCTGVPIDDNAGKMLAV